MKVYDQLDKLPSGQAKDTITEGTLVLEGGGWKGLYTLGVLDAMMENDLNFSSVVGVSAGALSAMGYVSGQIGWGARIDLTYRHDKNYCGIGALRRDHGITGFSYLYDQILKDLPIDEKRLNDPKRQLVVSATNLENGEVEYFEKGTSTKDGSTWEKDAGISLMGGYSRLNDKKSVSIRLREEYEDGSINYPLFETRKGVNDKYKAFNLRNNGNRFVSDYIEDAMAGALLEGSGVDYQRSRQVVVFYNGKYYGIHDMRERFNKHFVETNYKIDANSVNFIKHLGKDVEASNGTTDAYMKMLSFVAKNDFSGENNANYTTVKTMLDVGNLADYMAAEIYVHNGDWPNNNVRAWSAPGYPWKFMVYDLDHGFDWMWGVNDKEFVQETNMFSWIKKGGGNKPCKEEGCFANLYNSLIVNPEFKRMFINRSAVMFNSYTNSANVTKVVDAMVATIDDNEMTRDLAKFKQDQRWYENACKKGFDKTGSCMKDWAASRDSKVIQEYQEEFGLGDMVTVTISASGNGSVVMDGMKLPKSTYEGKFFAGNTMELTAMPAAGAVFAGWSDGVTDATRIVKIAEGLKVQANFK